MDQARIILAIIFLITLPAAFLFWFLVHPFIGFWRRLGAGWTYAITLSLTALLGFGIFQWHERLLSVDYGTNHWLWPAAVILYAVAVWLERLCRRHLKWRILVGLPELRPGPSGGKLLTEGIYAGVRHPRYLSVILGMIAFALFINYRGIYLAVPLFILGLHVIVILEDRELRARFGEAHARYCKRVPALIPRWSSLKRRSGPDVQ